MTELRFDMKLSSSHCLLDYGDFKQIVMTLYKQATNCSNRYNFFSYSLINFTLAVKFHKLATG